MKDLRYMVESSWTEIQGADKTVVFYSRPPEDFEDDEHSAIRRMHHLYGDLVADGTKIDPVVAVTEQRVNRSADGSIRSTVGSPRVFSELRLDKAVTRS
jgi:hypothetical protein